MRPLASRKPKRIRPVDDGTCAATDFAPAIANEIARRKSEHVAIVLEGKVGAQHVTNGFDRIRFDHCALPEIDYDAIDLSSTLVGRAVRAPLLISSMTGGPLHASRINLAIAEAAGRCGIGFAVGSQRIALEGRGSAGFSRQLRTLAGQVPILANFGAAQLKDWDGPDMARRAIDMLEADALIVHVNPLQEAIQPGGDRNWSGVLTRIEHVVRTLDRPVVVKEVGAGISGAVARQLWNVGIRVIDVAGAGGTSWAAVEGKRASSSKARAAGEAFHDWGIPTAEAIVSVRAACPEAHVIGSGGIRNGIDAAKAIRLGANTVGQAAAVLPAAIAGVDAIVEHIDAIIEQLRIACFCTGSAGVSALREAPIVACAARGDAM